MRHEHHTSGKLLDSLHECGDTLHVQVVRGLIQEQQVRAVECDRRKHHSVLLSSRERLDRLEMALARQAEHAEVLAQRLVLVLGVLFVQVHDWRHVGLQLVGKVLREPTDAQARRMLHVAARRSEVLGKQVQQRTARS